jgi:methyl-accepting chemotaxis protein
LTAIIAIGALAAIFMGILISRSVIRQLGTEPAEIRRIAGRMAAGELDIDFKSSSEPIGAFAEILSMVGKLREVVGGIQAATKNVTGGSEQNNDNSLATEQLSRKAALDAEEGGAAVGDTVKAMKEIASSIGIIEEIAHQTNLLAHNAAASEELAAASEELASSSEELSSQAMALLDTVSFLQARSRDPERGLRAVLSSSYPFSAIPSYLLRPEGLLRTPDARRRSFSLIRRRAASII